MTAGFMSMGVPHWLFVVICFLFLLATRCHGGCPFSQVHLRDMGVDERQSDPNVVPCHSLVTPPESCDPSSPYRTPDGTCNNLKHPTWGAANTTLLRLMHNYYRDGLGKPYAGVDGRGLPNPRSVSLAVNQERNVCLDNSINALFWIFAQFTMGDMVNSAWPITMYCALNANPDACISIPIPPEDTFNRQYGVTELNIPRRSPPCYDGVFDPSKERISVNLASIYIDVGAVYGVNNFAQSEVRTFKTGKLKVDSRNPDLMPVVQTPSYPAFLWPDPRAGMDPGVALLGGISVHAHNHLCDLLHDINPRWQDERLYQEAKRITTAIYQGVIYQELLPLFLGPERMRQMDLQLPFCRSEYTTYDPEVHVGLYAEVSSAALRMHTGVPNDYSMDGRSPAPLKDNFLTAKLFTSESDATERLLRGLLKQCAMKYDRFVSDLVQNHALQPAVNGTHGTDLAATDLRRCEDSGIPPYMEFRRFVGAEVPNNFQDLSKIWNDAVGTRLVERLYKGQLEDIHASLGMIMEPHVLDGAIGNTSSHILALQFKAMKEGDRFFVTHGNQAGSFTKCQLKAIRSTLFSHMLCLAFPDVKKVPQNAFQNRPPYIECADVTFDISPWKEKKGKFQCDDCDVQC